MAEDTVESSDFLQANALRAAQELSRSSMIMRDNFGSARTNQRNARAEEPEKTKNSDNDDSKQLEEIEKGNLEFQIHLLERRGKELKKAARKDEAAAESLEISNTWVDMVGSGFIEVGKATLEIIIGFLILPAGFIIKTVKFFFDRQVTTLKSSSQKKDAEGDKLLTQAAKLKGARAPLKRAADAAIETAKNYIAELLFELFPLGISPTALLKSAQEKQKAIYKYLLRAAFFCFAMAISLAFVIALIYLVLEFLCSINLPCYVAVKIFNISPQTLLKATAN